MSNSNWHRTAMRQPFGRLLTDLQWVAMMGERLANGQIFPVGETPRPAPAPFYGFNGAPLPDLPGEIVYEASPNSPTYIPPTVVFRERRAKPRVPVDTQNGRPCGCDPAAKWVSLECRELGRCRSEGR